MKPIVRSAVAVLVLGLLGCAGAGFVPESSPMPAARAGLRPEYRIFYDSLIDHGDWVLIEPYGFVFRPRVNFVAWRPYDDGFWVPTDLYGWVWVSSEPFGWATYHYGRWLFDDYRGWVWVPGLDWGPAWVNWYSADNYIGWSPRLAPGSGAVPEGAYSFVPMERLASPNQGELRMKRDELGAAVNQMQRIDHQVEVQGVFVPAGPRIQDIERVAGPLTRVRIEDLVAPGDVASLRDAEAGASGKSGETKDAKDLPATSAPTPDAMRRAGEQAAREARSMIGRKQVGSIVPVVRPFGVPAGPGTSGKATRAPAAKKPASPAPKGAVAAPPDSAR